ncbi:hypothetical protein HYDPIDRAFT_86812 [Hydnomerulius pinastri MD-312]|nr:hypothetical protein HYDPIDRAFT_86812 [Hydnomerulius pinastri MD-312]
MTPAVKTLHAILSDLGLPERIFPPSFADTNSVASPGVRASPQSLTPSRNPDVTAIILNWSRLENVIRIASLLCGPWLDDTIAEVLIWNNSPQKLSKEIFSKAQCDTRKLRIENSSENLYFYARFLAATKASTSYCFIQDDDYIVLPEIIRTLRVRMEDSSQTGIHLLPPHEHLSSRLRETITPTGVHAGFAWLGHGAMIRQQQAVDFVALLKFMEMTLEEIKMADNYYTVLNNQVPEIWFDQGIELGGGQPFTVGTEGDERNRRHIRKACHYLDQALERMPNPAEAPHGLQFVNKFNGSDQPPVSCAPGLGTSCLLETNVKLLPDDNIISCNAAVDMLGLEESRAMAIGQDALSHYQQHPLSFAVDGIPETAFRSPYNAKQGDYFLLDMLSSVASEETMTELVFLVSPDNEWILRKSKFESSSDGRLWLASPHPLVCRRTKMTADPSLGQENAFMIECSVRMLEGTGRFFKALLEADASVPWVIFEVWVRSMASSYST